MDRLKTALYISIGATVFSILSFALSSKLVGLSNVCFVIGVGGAVVAYLIGGFFTAIKMALDIAKWGFIVVPFPFNLALGIVTFIYAIGVFVFIPVIPVSKAYRENR